MIDFDLCATPAGRMTWEQIQRIVGHGYAFECQGDGPLTPDRETRLLADAFKTLRNADDVVSVASKADRHSFRCRLLRISGGIQIKVPKCVSLCKAVKLPYLSAISP